MLTFRQIYQLREDKSSYIKKYGKEAGVSTEVVNTILNIYKKFPHLESAIKDWRKTTWQEIIHVADSAGKSKTQKIKRQKLVLSKAFKKFQQENQCKIWFSNDDIILVSPFTWKCANFMNDHACYGPKAEWCIGTLTTTKYWNDHVIDDEECFIFIYLKENSDKWMIQRVDNTSWSLWDAKDSVIINDVDTLNEIFKDLNIDKKMSENDYDKLLENITENIEEFYQTYKQQAPDYSIPVVRVELYDYVQEDLWEEYRDNMNEVSLQHIFNSINVMLECMFDELIFEMFTEEQLEAVKIDVATGITKDWIYDDNYIQNPIDEKFKELYIFAYGEDKWKIHKEYLSN